MLEVLDKLLIIVKKALKNVKKKLSLKEIINNILFISIIYKVIYINKHFLSFIIINCKNMSLFQFFKFYISN